MVSSADPSRLRAMVGDALLTPEYVKRIDGYERAGSVAKVNLALSEVPRFVGTDDPERLRGRIVIAPGVDYLERAADAAKYRRVSTELFLEANFVPGVRLAVKVDPANPSRIALLTG